MNDKPTAARFGTFGGVFTPCTLTILGVIMFLRFGQVVGQSGVYAALGIVLVAKLITLLTTFSLSAIATNTRVKGGGAYYLISRSLGVEFGTIIGVVLFLAQAVSVSMYVIGFTEAFVDAFPATGLSFRAVATIVNVVTFVCVFVGAGWTIKVQYGILAILGLSLVSFFVGALPDASLATLAANSRPGFLPGESLFTMFALFFPAVTGIMAGANMSGDLASPSKSIPRGTLLAIGATAAVYLGMALLLGASRPRAEFVGNALIVKDIAWMPVLITAGVFAATLSSALGSMMGAPRILQAFARDDIFPAMRVFAAGSGKTLEPRRATVLTLFIAQLGVFMRDLDAIAPVITMFFMITYGTLNLACFYEAITRNPSYRPTFPLRHWSLALAGTIGCALVMLLMNPLWALTSMALMGALYSWVSRREIIARWGDVGSGIAYERARKALLKLEEEYYHPKNWRPAILVLSGGATSRFHLAEYAYWLASGHGILTLAQIISDGATNRVERRQQAERRLRRFILDEGLSAFPVAVLEPSLTEGLSTLLQAHGIGGMRPNTVLLGLSRNPERLADFCAALRVAQSYERSIAVIDCEDDREHWQPGPGSIDVFWHGREHIELMILLAHLLKTNPEWRARAFRVLAALPALGDAENKREELTALLDAARIDATVHVFSGDDPYVTLAKRTGNSAVLFVPFDPPAPDEEAAFFEWTDRLRKLVPDIVLVHSARDSSLEA